MKRNIDQMDKLIEHHNIYLPEGAMNTNFGSKTNDHERYERCHALKVGF